MKFEEISEKIIGGFYQVYNTLGFGFLEKVYENALVIELQQYGLQVVQQKPIPVYYQGNSVGSYFADILVNGIIILELKAAENIKNEHFSQVTHYLKASDKELGFLLNFGRKPEFKRIIFSNDRKTSLISLNPPLHG